MKPNKKQKDCQFRRNYFLSEKRYFLLKLIQSNQFTPFKVRIDVNFKINKLTKSSRAKIINRCLITNHSRSIYRPFNLNRNQFRLFATNCQLIGVKKASW